MGKNKCLRKTQGVVQRKKSSMATLTSKHTEVRHDGIISWDITVTYGTIPSEYQNAYTYHVFWRLAGIFLWHYSFMLASWLELSVVW